MQSECTDRQNNDNKRVLCYVGQPRSDGVHIRVRPPLILEPSLIPPFQTLCPPWNNFKFTFTSWVTWQLDQVKSDSAFFYTHLSAELSPFCTAWLHKWVWSHRICDFVFFIFSIYYYSLPTLTIILLLVCHCQEVLDEVFFLIIFFSCCCPSRYCLRLEMGLSRDPLSPKGSALKKRDGVLLWDVRHCLRGQLNKIEKNKMREKVDSVR